MFKSNINGFDDVFNILDNLMDDKEEVKRKAVNAGGLVLKEEMAELAPHDDKRKRGKHLDETIRKTTKINETGEIVTRVYPTKFYDLFREYGASDTTPSFFVARTWNGKKDIVAKIMTNIIMKYIDKQLK